MTRAAAIVGLGIATAIATGYAQAPPVRDGQRVVLIGAGSISGTVIADEAGRPAIRRVTLTLIRAATTDSRTTATDDRGRYVFDRLPAGVYSLNASKGGYVTTSYGAAKPGQQGSPIPLGEGQRFAALPLVLARGAVIAGRLLNPRGRPMSGTIVQVNQFRIVNGERRARTDPASSSSTTTDAHGAYRIYGLSPGDYVVSATPFLDLSGQELRELTAAELQWAQQQTRNPASVAVTAPAAISQSSNTAPPAGRPSTYSMTFFPGTVDAAGAAVITLGRGEERAGVDFQLKAVPTARISGVITGVDGQPAPSVLVARTPRQMNSFVATGGSLSARTGPDGRFALGAVTPGDYSIVARLTPGAGPFGRGTGAAAPAGPTWGIAEVIVQGVDIPDVAIQLQPGMRVSGRVVFEGMTTPPAAELTRMQLRLTWNSVAAALGSLLGSVNADGSFRFDGAMPGSNRFSVTLAGSAGSGGWFAKTAMLNGQDLLDGPFDISAGSDVTDLVLTFSDRQTELAGMLVDAQGQPTPQLSVLVYPTDRTFWTPGARRTKPARAGVDGTFKIVGLPAGDYYLCALTELDPAQMYDPEYLEQFVSASIKISLADGERRVQNLRVGG